MAENRSEMRLFDARENRLYMDAGERQAVLAVAREQERQKRTFCETLYFTGCRLSEALELPPKRVENNAGQVILRSLKKCRDDVFWAVPVPAEYLDTLDMVLGIKQVRRAKETEGCAAVELERRSCLARHQGSDGARRHPGGAASITEAAAPFLRRSYEDFEQGRGSIKTEIESMVRSQLKPRLIFYHAVDLLIEQNVALPSSDALSDEEEATTIKNQLQSELSDADYFDILEEKSLRMQNRATPVLKGIRFNAQSNCEALSKAIEHCKFKDGAIDESAPIDFLRQEELSAVSKGKFRVSLYKALLFIHSFNSFTSDPASKRERLTSSTPTNTDYWRPLEDYLISNQRWQKEKEGLLERAGLNGFSDPKEALKGLNDELFGQYLKTNDRIRDGSNEKVGFTKSGTLRVTTPKLGGNQC
jgi:hypothetical protein